MLFVLRRLRSMDRDGPLEEADDGKLIDLARDGNLDAFNVLVDRYRQAVYGVALRYMRSPDLADDVTQDAFIRAYKSLDTFRNEAGRGFRAWLLRIASNRALDVLRSQARRPATSLEVVLGHEERTWEPEDERETPMEFAERDRLAQHLEEALGEISEDQRLVVVLYDVQGYSYEEIAEISDVAVGTVKSRLHRGRARLREVLLEQSESRELLGRPERHSNDADSG